MTTFRSPVVENMTQTQREESLALQRYLNTTYVIVDSLEHRNALSPQKGTRCFVVEQAMEYIWNGTVWIQTFPEMARDDDDGTTTSTTFTDLTGSSAGPAVTLDTGTEVHVTVGANLGNDNSLAHTIASFAVSGATTTAALDVRGTDILGQSDPNHSKTVRITGLTAGANTFTMKYRVTAGTGTFTNRNILVTPVYTP